MVVRKGWVPNGMVRNDQARVKFLTKPSMASEAGPDTFQTGRVVSSTACIWARIAASSMMSPPFSWVLEDCSHGKTFCEGEGGRAEGGVQPDTKVTLTAQTLASQTAMSVTATDTTATTSTSRAPLRKGKRGLVVFS